MKGEWLLLLLVLVIGLSEQAVSAPAKFEYKDRIAQRERGGACKDQVFALKMEFRNSMKTRGGPEEFTFLLDFAKTTYHCSKFTPPECEVGNIARKIRIDISKMRDMDLLNLIGGRSGAVLKASDALQACLAAQNHTGGFQERSASRIHHRLAEAYRMRLTDQVITEVLTGKVPSLPQRKIKRDGNDTDVDGDGVVDNDNGGYQNYDEYYDNTGSTGNTGNTGDQSTDTTVGGPGDANVGDSSDGTTSGLNTGGDNAGNIGPGGEIMGQSGYYDDIFVDDLGSYVKSSPALNIGDVIAMVILTTILFVLALATIVRIAEKLFPGEVNQKKLEF